MLFFSLFLSHVQKLLQLFEKKKLKVWVMREMIFTLNFSFILMHYAVVLWRVTRYEDGKFQNAVGGKMTISSEA